MGPQGSPWGSRGLLDGFGGPLGLGPGDNSPLGPGPRDNRPLGPGPKALWALDPRDNSPLGPGPKGALGPGPRRLPGGSRLSLNRGVRGGGAPPGTWIPREYGVYRFCKFQGGRFCTRIIVRNKSIPTICLDIAMKLTAQAARSHWVASWISRVFRI